MTYCPGISHVYVFDDADFDFNIKKTLTFTVLMLLPVYGKWVITSFFFILSMDFSETWWVLGVNRLESDKIFDHHILLPLFIVLPVFEEQVRCHAPNIMSYKTARVVMTAPRTLLSLYSLFLSLGMITFKDFDRF